MKPALTQIAGVIRLELKKTFLSRRGWWVYLLALAPVGLALLHSVSMERIHWRGHNAIQDTKIYAAMFQTYFLHLGIFFGCVGIFTNLFRAEMLEKTLHYYFLAPLRREWLVIAKYLTGLLVAAVLFPASAGLSMYFMGRHQGAAGCPAGRHRVPDPHHPDHADGEREQHEREPGRRHGDTRDDQQHHE